MSLSLSLTDDIEPCLDLRRRVFINEQSVPEAEEIDGRDPEALHLLARVDDVPAGTARILLYGSTGKIGRVCVLADYRGRGVGAALILASLDVLRDQAGVSRALLGAQIQALGFYERLGFAAFGPVYDDAGIAHRDMERAV